MYIVVRDVQGAGTIDVREPDDCTRLHLDAPESVPESELGALLEERGWGRAGQPGQVWLRISKLRREARTGVDGWPERFDRMIDYARDKGWCDQEGTHVAAHVERI